MKTITISFRTARAAVTLKGKGLSYSVAGTGSVQVSGEDDSTIAVFPADAISGIWFSDYQVKA